MKTLTTIQEWLATNPNEVEINKVLKLVNKSVVSQTRSEYYKKDRYLHKMNKAVENLKELKLPVPKEYAEIIKQAKKEVDDLKKLLPPTVKRLKKEEK